MLDGRRALDDGGNRRRDGLARYWNGQTATFDDEADHDLRDAQVREAWRKLLLPLMPNPPARVADLGSSTGTGTLAVLLADVECLVSEVDLWIGMPAFNRGGCHGALK
jgi:hypothetical protein